MKPNSVEQYVFNIHKRMKNLKQQWIPLYEEIAKFILNRQRFFDTIEELEGDFLWQDIYDNKGALATETLASVLLHLLWPSGPMSVQIKPSVHLEDAANRQDIKEFFEKISLKIPAFMNLSKARLNQSLQEMLEEAVGFGTSALLIEKQDLNVPLKYISWGINGLLIESDAFGEVNKVAFEYSKVNLADAVTKYGLDRMSDDAKESYKKGDLGKTLHIVQMVLKKQKGSPLDNLPLDSGSIDMPYYNIVFEYGSNHIKGKDNKDVRIIRADAMRHFNCVVLRFQKNINETYGRCPAMKALPDIRAANHLWEAVIKAIETNLDPALGVLEDILVDGEVIHTGPGAVNMIRVPSGVNPQDTVFRINEQADIPTALEYIREVERLISEHFYLDRLLDFNTETEMTAYETRIRNIMRGQAHGSLMAHVEQELFVPLVQTSIKNIDEFGLIGVERDSRQYQSLTDKGITPIVVPEAILRMINQGLDWYRIEFNTTATRIRQSEQLEAIMSMTEFVSMLTQVSQNPTALDTLNIDRSANAVARLTGVPTEVKNSDQEKDTIRQQRQQQMEAQAQLSAGKEMSEIARNASQAQATARNGGNTTRGR